MNEGHICEGCGFVVGGDHYCPNTTYREALGGKVQAYRTLRYQHEQASAIIPYADAAIAELEQAERYAHGVLTCPACQTVMRLEEGQITEFTDICHFRERAEQAEAERDRMKWMVGALAHQYESLQQTASEMLADLAARYDAEHS